MSIEFIEYAILVLIAALIAFNMVGVRRALTIHNMAGWWLLVFLLSYIVHPAAAELTHDTYLYSLLQIATIEEQWLVPTVAVCLSLICFGFGYRYAGKGHTALPVREPRLMSQKHTWWLAVVMCTWGYLSVVLSGGVGGQSTNDAGSGFGIAESGTFWLYASDLFISSGATLLYVVTRRLSVSLWTALPWLLLRISFGYSRIVIIGHVMSLLAVWGLVGRSGRRRYSQLLLIVLGIGFVVAVVFPAATRDRQFFRGGITTDKVTQAIDMSSDTSGFARTTGDFAGFEATLYHLQRNETVWGSFYAWFYFIKPIPRSVWPGKGFPDSLAIEWFGFERDDNYRGQDAGAVGWAFQQWSWPGIIFEFFFTGWAIRRLENWKDGRGYLPYVAFGYSGFFSMLPQLGRSSLIYMVHDRWLFAYGIPMVILYIIEKRLIRRNVRSAPLLQVMHPSQALRS